MRCAVLTTYSDFILVVVPVEVRSLNSLETFRMQIKQIEIPCACKLYTQYISNRGHIT